MPRAAAGLLAAAAVALLAARAGSLDRSGALAATILGAAAVAAGWDWAFVLIVFFVTSSALSRIGRARKAARTASILEARSARDWKQVVANGGVFGAAALGWLTSPSPLWIAVGGGAIAAAAADTWATECGTLWGGTPRSLRGWMPVPPGTSGGVTVAGLVGELAGALAMAGAAALAGWGSAAAGAMAIGGVVGASADSWLGATLQETRRCVRCGAHTERTIHDCGGETVHAGGARGLDNDAVNLAATVAGACTAILVARGLA